ncbi:hypothetical protein ACNKHX_07405 [Shigella flexneri]
MNNSIYWNVTSNSNLDTLALASTVDFASHGSTARHICHIKREKPER